MMQQSSLSLVITRLLGVARCQELTDNGVTLICPSVQGFCLESRQLANGMDCEDHHSIPPAIEERLGRANISRATEEKRAVQTVYARGSTPWLTGVMKSAEGTVKTTPDWQFLSL